MPSLYAADYVRSLWPYALEAAATYKVSPVGLIAVTVIEATPEDGSPWEPENWGQSEIALACENIAGLNAYAEVLKNARVQQLVGAPAARKHDTQQWRDGRMTDSPDELFLNFPKGERGRSLEVWAMWGRGKFFPGVQGRYANNQADALTKDAFRTFVTNMVRPIDTPDGVDRGWCPTPKYVENVMRAYQMVSDVAGQLRLYELPPASTPVPTPAGSPLPTPAASAPGSDRVVLDALRDVMGTMSRYPAIFEDPKGVEHDTWNTVRLARDEWKAKVSG